MGKLRSIVFIAMFALVCCSAGLNAVLSKVAPEHFSADSYLTGGQGEYITPEELFDNPQKLLTDREFAEKARNSIERGFGEYVPYHDSLLLLSAGLQRQGIATANLSAGYDAYPTFYGSRCAYIPEQSAVTYIPETGDESFRPLLKEFAQGLASKAAEHPDLDFVLYFVQGKSTPASSPLYDYMSDIATPDEVVEILEGELEGVENVKLLTDGYATLDEYYEDYFRTDHHWNAKGAARAYNTIATEMGWGVVDADSVRLIEGYEDFQQMGTNARIGLATVTEGVFDLDMDFSQLQITYADGKTLDGNDHTRFTKYKGEDKRYVFHSRYFNSPNQTGHFVNTADGAAGKTLLISDSYGGAISKLLATQCEVLDRTNDLYNESKGRKFEESLAVDDYDTVVLVAHASDFTTLMENSPEFFE